MLLLGLPLAAQDNRTVTEPRLPAACVTLKAHISSNHGVIAPADERRLDTGRIQRALDTCSPGKAVVLRADGRNNVFLTGPLTLRSNVTLIVDANTALVASRDPRVFDITTGSCGIVAHRGHGCRGLIVGNGIENAGIMGAGSIDGRGGATLLGQNVSWWDLAHQAKITDEQQSVLWLILLRRVRNFTLYNITLRNSPGFHVAVNQSDGFTAWGVKIMTPKTARNTDGIDPGSSTNVTIEHCFIHTGDDDVAVKSGGATPASHISILHNHFYTGHGMSIGSGTSGGVDHMLVDDLTIDGADNGIRIKSDRSRGGLVHNLLYKDVCIRDTRNPLVFTPLYTTFSGNLLPVYRDIILENIHIVSPGSYTFLGLDSTHKLELTLDKVFADDQRQSQFFVKDANFTIGPALGNLTPTGIDVAVSQSANSHTGSPLACDARFVPFPPLPNAPEMAGKVPPEDKTYYVAADGTGDYYSIQRALDAVPATGHALILVAPGTYREILTINKPYVQIRSADSDASKTIVVNDRSAGANGGTLHSATVNVRSDNFFAENITFANDFNQTHPQLPEGSQAVALLVTGDRDLFHNVRLLGNQDTVYAGSRNCSPEGSHCIPTRQYFSDCFIAGNVDFIFGDGKAVFDHCEIRSTPHNGGFITAQSRHYPAEDSGYVLDHCKLTADARVTGKVYLGRPWRPYATVIYLHTWMGDHIAPAGWHEWHPGETHSLDTAYYAEFDSTGPGAHPSQRDPHTRFLTPQQAAEYAPSVFLRGSDNWNPLALPKPPE
ncbi:MAG TPA: pectinesterase family protein [Terracidiphilus sp.]|nr:pectinesterase family protein [Terracidiphilus sp.]